MNCPKCGRSIPADARFCTGCGAKMIAVCAVCGGENPGGSAFCAHCGASLQGTGIQSRDEPASREGLEPVLRSRTMIEGERKEISVLFADITGSTEIIAGLDPEQAMTRLDGAVRAMTLAVRRYGGFDRPQGDGIMALFGAPLADQDHAARACLAALAMQAAVASLGESGILIRVGIHSGPVVVRSVRTGLATDFDAIGETVHLAARMEQVAESGTIRITGETCRLAKEFIRVRALGSPPVKGIVADVEQFELIDRTSLRTLWDARASARLTPFVARSAELQILRQAAIEARAGSGRMVLISGDPGVGKSRLLHEFLSEFRTDSWTVLRCGAMPFSLNAPYAMLTIMLSSWLGLDERDSIPAERLRNAVDRWPAAGRWAHAAFSAILGLPAEDVHWRTLDPSARRRQTLDAVANWTAWLSEQRPLLLVFEDMQWADGESAAIVSLLASRAPSMPLLILASMRQGEGGASASAASTSVLRLEALPMPAAQEMAEQLLGNHPSSFALQRLLVDKTGGVPFFIEETARALAETGVLDERQGGRPHPVSIEDIRVPANVRLVLSARIDRLPPAEKELLQVAAVIGYEVPLDILKFVADLPQSDVQQRVLALESAGFLRTSSAGLGFEHMLTRDVAYDTLLRSRRKALHQRVVAALERREGAEVHLLAHHAFQAGLWPEVLKYTLHAGNRAVELSAYTEATKLLEHALEALVHLPRTANYLAHGIDVRLGLRAVLGATSDFPRIARLLEEAREIASEIGDTRRLAAIAISEAMMHNQLGHFERAVSAATTAQELAAQLEDDALAIPARLYLGQAHLWRGEIREAIAALESGTEWTAGAMRQQRLGTTGATSVPYLGFLASANAFTGRFGHAERLADEAGAIAREAGRPYDLVVAGYFRGWIMCCRGRFGEAVQVLEETSRLCEIMEIHYFIPAIATLLGLAYAESGRMSEGTALLSRALAMQKSRSSPYGEAWSAAWLGFARLREGDIGEAAALGRWAAEIAAAHGYRVVQVMAERLLGAAAGRQGTGATDEHFDNAITRAEALGLRPELAHCRFERGLLLRDLQRTEEARRELEMASTLYAEMGMEFWRAKAAAALDGLGGAVRQ